MMREQPMLPRPFRVVSTTRETADVATLELEPADGSAAMDVAPGQFNMLYMFGVGEVPISASSGPTESLLGHTIREVGAVTRALCAACPGDLVGVRGPFGHPWPLDHARGRDLLLIAGGIGLAPLRPAILSALAERERFNSVCILYGARTPADLLFLDDLERWKHEADQVLITVDAAGEDWTGDVGVVNALLRRTQLDPENTVAFMCGPEIMMRYTARDLRNRNVSEQAIHLSLERSFSCALGLCGRCQLGPEFVCKDGPVFVYPTVSELLAIPEL